MKALLEAVRKWLRGSRMSRLLARCGIDPKRFWLLMDLFDELSDRGEMMDQLGRNGVALRSASWLYLALSGLIAIVAVAMEARVSVYFSGFLFFTAFLFLSVLLSETSNSLVNPAEALVLAHQPIPGGTYTAAKLCHLLRIVLLLGPALNGIPACAGLLLTGARWWYPLAHLGAALAVGVTAALLCCALFGWLMRFVPPRRLKAVGQFAGAAPFLAMIWMGQITKFLGRFHLAARLPVDPAARWALAIATGLAALLIVAMGIRSLSADYLLRVSAMMRGGARAGSRRRRSVVGALVARFRGGQPARAGCAFVSRMMLRDWQFRRQFFTTCAPFLLSLGSVVAHGWPGDPFSHDFSMAHLVPHSLGVFVFFACVLLPFGSDPQGAWIFKLVPARTIDRFASGVHAMLGVELVVVPNLLLLPVFAWRWGAPHAVLFTAFAMATGSIYLALGLRQIEAIPFSRKADPSRSATQLPVMLAAGIVIAIAVGLQYRLIFRWPALAVLTTVGCAAAGAWLGQASIRALAESSRYHLGLESAEVGPFYKEVEA